MNKTIIDYIIPIQDKKYINDVLSVCKKLLGEDFEPTEKYLTTDEHIDILIDKLCEAIDSLGSENGWYIGDDIKVRIELEYEPEDK